MLTHTLLDEAFCPADGDTELGISKKPRIDTDKTPETGVPIHLQLLRWFLALVLFPLTILMCWNVIHPNEALVVTVFGRLLGVFKEAGCVAINPWGADTVRVSTKHETLDLGNSTIADANGNPVVVGGVVTYTIEDPVKAVFNVEHVVMYVKVQAMAVLKSGIAQYPYESTDPHVPTLKNSSQEIAQKLGDMLQERVLVAGVEIAVFDLSDLKYSSEIAAAMLVRQQAQATVDARHTIVAGAVEIVGGAIDGLAKKGVQMSETEVSRLASNLLCVVCSDTPVNNVIPM